MRIFHGAKDDTVPPEESQKMYEALKACGGDVRFTLYPEADHLSWVPAYADLEPGTLQMALPAAPAAVRPPEAREIV